MRDARGAIFRLPRSTVRAVCPAWEVLSRTAHVFETLRGCGGDVRDDWSGYFTSHKNRLSRSTPGLLSDSVLCIYVVLVCVGTQCGYRLGLG